MQGLLALALIAGQVDFEPHGPTPNEAQLAWHDRTFYAFIHFGPNTFTGVEWGEGRESPSVFVPEKLDARQWTRAFKAAGMTGVIITAKHHDGFCIWPSAVTEHDVAASPWKDGKGDVLRELSDACAADGLWLGVYLSPWDRHEATYGTGVPYDDHFCTQLDEVLTNYGPIAEVWFDGACGEGPNGKRQVYDWDRYVATVRKHQPNAVIFSDAGPDVRWCGNERAIGNETNWATLNRAEIEIGTGKTDELNLGHAGGTHWIPYECNRSIRPGWFWRESEDDGVMSVDALIDNWYASVGRNGNFLLNVPPDTDGLIGDTEIERLARMGEILRATHARDLLADAVQRGGVVADASDVRPSEGGLFAPARMLTPDRSSFWATSDGHDADGEALAWVEFKLPEDVTFDEVWLEEPVGRGQRIEAFRVRVANAEGEWRDVATGTTIGVRRILRTSKAETARRVRVEVLASRATPALSRLSLYRSPPRVVMQPMGAKSLSPVAVSLTAPQGAVIRYTLDGSPVTKESPVYESEIRVAKSCTLTARAFARGVPSPYEAKGAFRILTEADMKAPIAFVKAPVQGLRVARYVGAWQTLDQMARRDPIGRAECDGFDIGMRTRSEMCALSFEGFVRVPEDGLYTFSTSSDDGSRLWIHGELVVDNDGLHGMEERSGRVALRAGHHPIRVAWFNARGGLGLDVRWSGPGIGRAEAIPNTALFR